MVVQAVVVDGNYVVVVQVVVVNADDNDVVNAAAADNVFPVSIVICGFISYNVGRLLLLLLL